MFGMAPYPPQFMYLEATPGGRLARQVGEELKRRFDRAIVRYDAWFLVFVAAILALGAFLAAGMAVWCVVYQSKRFTGNWVFKDFGLKVYFECK